MSAQPIHGPELIPKPAQTPLALYEAVAALLPHRLTEMTADQARAMTEAVENQSLKPLLRFTVKWAVDVEIARHPETLAELHRAEYLAHHAQTPEERRKQAALAGAIVDAAAEAVRG
ncbi:hypothetical protein [Kitasatospora sp. DSM 101779]|uniref:hypothetical protein n=1 Tax=Kitasatospora sp. DSM 101779 TaxID=2853165 RepID=UPI0021D980FF|nr:hypothetical protein [Kitasatospora sp. DSM 101779]MCU7827380.1 hypothetical protein [Kitasatospora sp. DSM 101779]